MDAPDPLLCLRAAFSAFPDAPLTLVKLRTESGETVEDIANSAQVAIEQIGTPSLTHDANAPELVFASDTASRILRTRETASKDEVPSPASAPDQFLSLGALVFAVQQRGERAGAYLRNAATAKVVPIPALERPGVLEYLLGKRDAWEGVVSVDGKPTVPSTEPSAEGKAEAAAPAPGAPSAKRGYVPDAADAEFVRNLRSKYEVVLFDRNDALAGTYGHAADLDSDSGSAASPTPHQSDALGLRALLKPRLESAKRELQAPSKSAPARTPGAPANAARRSRAQDPILLLSNSPTALVNMFNVKALLQDGVFVPPEEARRQARGVPELVVTIQPRSEEEGSGAHNLQFSRRILVVDSAEAVNRLGTGPAGSGQDPWNRVIAVFTTGQTWQFKTYRWSDPRDLFKNGTWGICLTQPWVCMCAGTTKRRIRKCETGT